MRVDVRHWLKAGWSGAAVVLLVAVGYRYFCTVALALVLAAYCAHKVRRAMSLRAMARWAAAMGCFPVEPATIEWPWQNLHLQGSSKVTYAWTGDIEGLPVTFGEVRWSGNAFGGAVLDRDGKGTFVVVGLPCEQPPMAIRLPYTVIGDSPRLEQPALRHAFSIMEIPPFTVRDTELFTVEPREHALNPGAAYRAVRRALLVVRLLDIGPDRPLPAAPDLAAATDPAATPD
ncbi:hypothetical protein OWR29_45635 [Actinoplanes sp. Pm04-4]|uniref:Uncharacterized protein n=1 Tax=Paractinoplanes pyxinae TaxID=2997416 RepID=A0ABT4BFK5_9ACTN|nr:hypothetical protein [Actinoplanes pyxinae]MCY1145329.1 hypothetical protein [Actinoplanes pyxinae]